MPLIDYRTSFTSLKYGRDGFGETGASNSSKQPYIKSSIPAEYLGTTGGPDFLLQRPRYRNAVRSEYDRERLLQGSLQRATDGVCDGSAGAHGREPRR